MINLSERLAALTVPQRELLSRRLAALSTPNAGSGRLQLVAYYTLRESMEGQLGGSEAMALHLRTRLPAHMRPQAIVELTSFPRLPNGKIDLAKLPAPEGHVRSDFSTGSDASRPEPAGLATNSAVNKLAAILGELLGMDDVQANDNFFELGGDSITAIQFVSMAREAGIDIGIAALTQQATLNEIANSQDTAAAKVQATTRVGPTPPTAIQAWFFDQNHPVPSRWNQAGRQSLTSQVSADVLERSVRSTIARYPELGQRFYQEADQWRTQIPSGDPPDDLVVRVKLRADSAELSAQIESIQQSFQLSDGWMFRVLICVSSTGEAVELVWIAHHLVIDNLSAQSILREIELGCLKALDEASQFSPLEPGLPLRHWALQMHQVAEEYIEESKGFAPLTTGTHSAPLVTEADCLTVRRLISYRNPDSIGLANKVFSTQTLELVLAALAIAWRKEMSQLSTVIDVEAHGRDALGDAVDASQSVGWFTTFFPFELTTLEDQKAIVMAVKESFRSAKLAQRHFLIKRYLAGVVSSDQSITDVSSPSLLLNFSSQADVGQAGASRGFWTNSPLPSVALRAPSNIRSHPIEVNILSGAEGLECLWRFSEQLFDAGLVERLHEALGTALENVVDLAALQTMPVYSPSDFPDVDIDQDDLDNILDELGG